MDQNNLSISYWGLALLHVIHVSNNIPNKKSGDISPLQHITNNRINLKSKFLYKFGQALACKIVGENNINWRFRANAQLGYYVGSCEGNNGGSLVLIKEKSLTNIFIRRDIIPININNINLNLLSTNINKIDIKEINGGYELNDIIEKPNTIHDNNNKNNNEILNNENDIINLNQMNSNIKIPKMNLEEDIQKVNDLEEDVLTDDNNINNDSKDNQNIIKNNYNTNIDYPSRNTRHISTRRPDILLESNYSNKNIYYNDLEDLGSSNDFYECNKTISKKKIQYNIKNYDSDHPTLAQALHSNEKEQWEHASDIEINAILNKSVGVEIDLQDIPFGVQILPTKLILTKKYNALNEFIKHKARLVVLGNREKLLLQNLFSPTASERSLKLLFALSVEYGYKIRGLDVVGAFLYPEIDRDVYIVLPKEMTNEYGQRRHMKLLKTLYGLSTSSRDFYFDIAEFLIKNGYIRSYSDPCMFYKIVGSDKIIFVIHVDDFFIIVSIESLYIELIEIVKTKYEIVENINMESFLGYNILYNEDGSITITQPGFLSKLLKEYNLQGANGVTTPMDCNFNDEINDNAELCDNDNYRKLLGALIFLLKSRPDISFAVNKLAIRCEKATIKDYAALIRILRYLLATQDYGLTFNPTNYSESKEIVKLYAWIDASYACHKDCKSQTGWCISFHSDGNGMIYSSSQKQHENTISSTEAEGVGFVSISKEITWWRGILNEIGFPQIEPTTIYSDSQSMITLASEYSGKQKHVKHFLIRIHYLMNQIQMGVIKFVKVHTSNNPADTLTKPNNPQTFNKYRNNLLGFNEK